MCTQTLIISIHSCAIMHNIHPSPYTPKLKYLHVHTYQCNIVLTCVCIYIFCYCASLSKREEIASLEGKVTQAREQYQQTVIAAKNDSSALSALPQFPIHDKFVLNQDEAWYTLSIEIQLPIDTVMLQVLYNSIQYCAK